MLGHLLVDPEPVPALDGGAVVVPDVDPEVLAPVVALVLDAPEVPELVEVPDAVDVPDVAASATYAPPTTRPEVSAPTASRVRGLIFIVCAFLLVPARCGAARTTLQGAPVDASRTTWGSARSSLTKR